MARLIQVLLIVALVFVALAFGSLNDAKVAVDYFFVQTAWPLAFSLLLFLMIGVAIGGLTVYLSMWLSLRKRLRAMRKEQTDNTQPVSPSTDLQRLPDDSESERT